MFAKHPHVRFETISGTKFHVKHQTQTAEDNEHGLESQQWYLVNKENNEWLSAWHDLDLDSKCGEDYTVTGVIEITQGTVKKLELNKHLPGNPVMQDYNKDDDGTMMHRNYCRRPTFNYGMLP